MVNSFISVDLAVVDNIDNSVGEILSIGRCSCLVKNDIELRTCCRKVEHGLDEVFAVFRIEPCGTDDYVAATAFQDFFFAVEFCTTIGSGRVERFFFCTWCVAEISAENIVCRDMDQRYVIVSRRLGKVADGGGVYSLCDFFLLFSTVDVGVGRAIDDCLKIVAFDT